MAYYAALISLEQTITRLLNSSHIPILPFDREIIILTTKKIYSLRRALDELERRKRNIRSKRVESLHECIREATCKLQDALDFHVSDQFLSRPERLGDEDSNSLKFSPDVSNEVLKREINNFANMVEKMEDKCSELSKYSLPQGEEDEEDDDDDDDDDDAGSSRIGYVGTETKMVGLSRQFIRVKEDLLNYNYHNHYSFCTFAISGMAGIGKTTMAKKIYHDLEVSNHFNCRLWVTVGQKYEIRKVLLCLLAQLDFDIDNIQTDGNEKLGDYLHTSLRSRRYLIVLDDVWDTKVSNELKEYLSFDDMKGQILVTTRVQVVQLHALARCQKLCFLDEEESWCLLREKVFGEKSCPYQLEKAGKKIAKNCDGLPLLIVKVADLLCKAKKTLEYWTKIAEGEDKSIFIEANDKISNVLLRSYNNLRQDLKSCLLYMGVFPPKCEIPASKLYDLWIAEDICVSILDANLRLYSLVSNNVALQNQGAAIGGTKTCSLHSSFWHACVKQAWKEKFLHVISSFANISKGGVKSQRRLCTYNNVLFGIKEVYNSVESISSARSLICSGPNHPYPIPICFGLRLLKVLDILSVRFYKFPSEVLKLIHLRYLALTYNGKIPPSISKLWNLEYLIVHRHLRIKFHGDWSYLPLEIWNLQNLRHLQVMGSCPPNPCGAFLTKLRKLSSISAYSCAEEIFGKIPNLEKLEIQIELIPNSDATEPLSCFDHISCLHQLQSLKCVILNPNPARPELVAPPSSITTFPSSLQKLSLSGFGYPWNYLRVIGKLPFLRVLKLRNYAFRGPKWVVHGDEFPRLRYLLLEDLDLVNMTFHGICSFPELFNLIIKHCYKFETAPKGLMANRMVELVDSPLIAKYMQKHREEIPDDGSFTLHIHSSWDDGEPKA